MGADWGFGGRVRERGGGREALDEGGGKVAECNLSLMWMEGRGEVLFYYLMKCYLSP